MRRGVPSTTRGLAVTALIVLGLLSVEVASAQTLFFLSRVGGALSLDLGRPPTLPSTTTSERIGRQPGDPWALVGTWSGPFPRSAFADVMSATDLRLWLGPEPTEAKLAVDMKAEVWVKG